MQARRYILKGRVQGVGFRYYTYQCARELGVQGWVKNLANGDVEVRAQGEEHAMKEFLNRIRSGPGFAVVSDIDVVELEPQDYQTFSIER